MSKRKSKTSFEKEGNISKVKLLYYYILPLWILKKKKSFNNMYSIKKRICQYFSIEKINELIKFKENLEDKSYKLEKKSIEMLSINNNCEKNSLDDSKIK